MQAIVTTFVNPTNTRGPRIRAKCEAGSVTIPFPHEYSDVRAYAVAAMALVRKLGWNEKGYEQSWVGGAMPGNAGYCFVIQSKLDTFAPDFGQQLI
ncbi:hypothetical protein [Paraburkholderia susongensis]|uniref:Uncharacterized protein n=1 Tax=Paraburkholderia susongensis TaxID=1515439 RepID=A0A1X7KNB6_9BURK|nr:hypothetical protein [Paraburkholderia susongensis]SMG42992.1 hypothetical protein SAMN06265784_104131 [Paraburkholderia susongensis]